MGRSGKLAWKYKICSLVISLLHVWQFGSAMVIFLAALKGVPQDLYEAASIDGAGKWRQFFSVTVPLITPVIFYNLITQLCTAFQEFNSAYIITKGRAAAGIYNAYFTAGISECI